MFGFVPAAMRIATTLLWIGVLPGPAWSVCCPTKVFLLAGQSNMVGMASIEHLKILLNDTKTHEEFSHLWNDTSNSFAQRDDVYAKFDDHVGKLTVGFGAPQGGGHFGTELEFGWALGDTLCDCQKPILLLKTAYGGRDLAIDFRPPSSGVGNYSGVKPMHFGWQYRDMITTILDGLENISTLIPQYDEEAGYELAGFVWFQGWNDMISWTKVAEYQFNLANLIRDVRADLDAPNMPFVIGELGMKGLHPSGQGADRYVAMQQAERAVAMMEEFRNSTMYVPTAKYVIANGSSYSGGEYHYFGRADTYCHIGRAFGEAMLSLMNKTRRLHTTCDTKNQMGPGWPEKSQARLRSTWSHGISALLG